MIVSRNLRLIPNRRSLTQHFEHYLASQLGRLEERAYIVLHHYPFTEGFPLDSDQVETSFKETLVMSVAYKILSVTGIIFTTSLLVLLIIGGSKAKTSLVAIGFINTAFFGYCNALLPWIFPFSEASLHTLFQIGLTAPPYVACSLNAIFGSYFRTVLASFTAAFVVDALRITHKIQKQTETIEPPESAFGFEERLFHSFTQEYKKNDPTQFLAPNKGRRARASPPKQLESVFKSQASKDASTVFPSRTYHMQTSESNSHTRSQALKTIAKSLRVSIFNLGSPVLCFLSIFSGIPQLILFACHSLGDHKPSILVNPHNCHINSNWANGVAAIIVIFMMILTVVLSTILGFILRNVRLSTGRGCKSSLEKTFLTRISLLSAQSIICCAIVTVAYFSPQERYHFLLDLFTLIGPMVSAAVLTYRESFIICKKPPPVFFLAIEPCDGTSYMASSLSMPYSTPVTKEDSNISSCFIRFDINPNHRARMPSNSLFSTQKRPVSRKSIESFNGDSEPKPFPWSQKVGDAWARTQGKLTSSRLFHLTSLRQLGFTDCPAELTSRSDSTHNITGLFSGISQPTQSQTLSGQPDGYLCPNYSREKVKFMSSSRRSSPPLSIERSRLEDPLIPGRNVTAPEAIELSTLRLSAALQKYEDLSISTKPGATSSLWNDGNK
ncbi:hypothetical protein O181_047458 [Austropuccinia psidii MF-1]|uniref:Uncharacterized protein n=1 Tax=Austropuccinia psidii MF-1 TaxID=1389203 RepID=A0A9Q3HJI8_9BASI|nr:hypothetical protein [Austropuccinia psidii MF-1]